MSLLTSEVMSWVGRSIEFWSDPISPTEVRRFVSASGDDNPRYALPETPEGSEETPVPPMLYYAVTRPLVPASELADDGTVHEHRPMIGTGQTMGGSVEVEWLRPLALNDRLRGVRTLASLNEKRGRRRDFVVAEWITEYWDKEGALVVRERYEQILF